MSGIHDRLRRLRLQQNLTINNIAEKTGISASTYKAWENGRQIQGEPYPALARVYQVSLQELITGEKANCFQILERIDRLRHELQEMKNDLLGLF
ncbi:MAG TPA: helix-turn-helix transcriptional regulator [Bdellovibrio sp.]|uniref:helix-turn-helix domain-containing protein n=1 Tax=Bdellovibrio sp. TaxID=28201 RepID=UPI002F1B6268